MTTFFTSDLHLGHARISELAGRPFGSVEEMDETLVERWNARVADGDIVWVLGDVCLGKLDESLKVAGRLRGEKLLVPGNHDRVSPLYRGSPAKKAEWHRAYTDVGGFKVMPTQLAVPFAGRTATLCHFPRTGDSGFEDRYVDARPADDGGWLLHGHTHQQERVSGERQVHVGVDAWDYAPASEDEVAELIAASS